MNGMRMTEIAKAYAKVLESETSADDANPSPDGGEWYHATRADRPFESFDASRAGAGDIGIHFGDRETAESRAGMVRGKPLIARCALRCRHPLDVTEDWFGSDDSNLDAVPFQVMEDILGAYAISGDAARRRFFASHPKTAELNAYAGEVDRRRERDGLEFGEWDDDRLKALEIAALEECGFDCIRYWNTYETDGSWSFIVWDPARITILGWEEPESGENVGESAEDPLTALKGRIDGMTPRQLGEVLDGIGFTRGERDEALMESGAVTSLLSAGSSRSAFLTCDGTVLKVADDPRGLAQNSAEASRAVEKNSAGCFTKVLWKSRYGYAIETEYASPLEGCGKTDGGDTDGRFADYDSFTGERDFGETMGVPLKDFTEYLRHDRFSGLSPKKRDAVPRAYDSMEKDGERAADVTAKTSAKVAGWLMKPPDTEGKRVLRSLAQYLMTHRSSADISYRDLVSPTNWGKVKRNGSTVCVVLDHGGTERLLDREYLGASPTELQRYR